MQAREVFVVNFFAIKLDKCIQSYVYVNLRSRRNMQIVISDNDDDDDDDDGVITSL